MKTNALPPPELGVSYRMTAPRAATTPKIVRDWLVLLLVTFGHEEIAEQARLCVSDAVTRAYLHTRADRITVEVSLGSTGVVVSVDDDRPGWLPVPRPLLPWRERRGSGLALIKAHTSELRTLPAARGTRMQFTLAYGEAA
ncbi:ATP-binding protein [Streptomyces sp. NPDC087297]|uniref:ATP-binding protein n=1 Tax=Streptomyces sp. NPDC087297 TaxID=3365778 RepID=UPI00382E470B